MNYKKFIISLISVFFLIFTVSVLDVQAAPATMAEGTVFDAEFYAAAYPDVAAVMGTDPSMLYMHYTLCGKAEGRFAVDPASAAPALTAGAADTGFDAAYYAARYPDVAAVMGTDPAMLKLHYDLCGKTEGRFGSAAEEAAALGIPAAPAVPGTTPAAPAGMSISMLGSRYAAVQADLTLSGTGTGYHAKILFQSAASGSAVSFGIQYDAFARAPWTGKPAYMCENIIHNGPGGQSYQWFGQAQIGVPVRLMMVLDMQTGIVDLYVNGSKIGSVGNTNLLAGMLCASVEGCARLDGDTVTASINNISIKKPGTSGTNGDSVFFHQCISRNPGIAATYSGTAPGNFLTSSNVTINGMVIGLNGLDWDSAYANVSGVGVYALWL